MMQTLTNAKSDRATALAVCLTCLTLIALPVAAHDDGAHGEHTDSHIHEDLHDDGHDDDDHDEHLSEIDGFRVLHGWTNATNGDTALVFMDLENTGTQTVELAGAEAGIAAQARLVGFRLVDGTPHYEALPSVPLAAGRKMQLAPNGLAIELTGLNEHLHEGDHFDMELHTSLGHVEIHVDVEAAEAMQHSHAGHAH